MTNSTFTFKQYFVFVFFPLFFPLVSRHAAFLCRSYFTYIYCSNSFLYVQNGKRVSFTSQKYLYRAKENISANLLIDLAKKLSEKFTFRQLTCIIRSIPTNLRNKLK